LLGLEGRIGADLLPTLAVELALQGLAAPAGCGLVASLW
jgi:hypothetical protein